nr:hypothetical protein [Tanacetum cinerariifolium]
MMVSLFVVLLNTFKFSDSSDDEYSCVDGEDLENVDFYTTGEEDVTIKNLTTHDDFFNRLCSTGGLFRGGVPKQGSSLPNIPEDDPNGSTIEPQFKVNKALCNYRVAHGYQLWFLKNGWKSLLVFCGRDIQKGKKGGSKVGLKKKVEKNKKVTFKEKKDKESGVGSSKPPVCSPHSSLSKQWTKKVIKEDNKSCYPFRNYNLGSLVNYRWIACQAKRTALYDHKRGLIDHYRKLWEYRQALIDLNPACASKGGGRGSRGGRMGRGNETMNVNDDAKAGVGRWTTVGRSRGRDRGGGGRGRCRKGTRVFLKTPTVGYSGGPFTYEQGHYLRQDEEALREHLEKKAKEEQEYLDRYRAEQEYKERMDWMHASHWQSDEDMPTNNPTQPTQQSGVQQVQELDTQQYVDHQVQESVELNPSIDHVQDMQVDDATTSSTKNNRKRPMSIDMQADEITPPPSK